MYIPANHYTLQWDVRAVLLSNFVQYTLRLHVHVEQICKWIIINTWNVKDGDYWLYYWLYSQSGEVLQRRKITSPDNCNVVMIQI